MSLIATLKEFQRLGCENKNKCAVAWRVFTDLKKDATVTDLQKNYDPSLKLLYLTGKRDGAIVNFVPVLSSEDLKMYEIERIQSKLANDDNKTEMNITLAICDTTPTILYYKISDGFVESKPNKSEA